MTVTEEDPPVERQGVTVSFVLKYSSRVNGRRPEGADSPLTSAAVQPYV